MTKKWIQNTLNEDENIAKLAQELNINKLLATLLYQRNIKTFDQAKSFFRPNLEELHDPFLMKDMDVAINRLSLAIQKQEKIMVYGDYDVDGTTSVAVVADFLKKIDQEVITYIPDRYTEGYGVSLKGIDVAKEEKCNLMIALDCGIRAVNQVDYATSLGIDMIICDHHLQGEELPKAVAILNPNRNDCTYPFKGLSGCGVGFKLLQGFCLQNDIELETIYEYLDLLTISIGADIVPLVDENRIISFYGLKKLSTHPRMGLKALLDSAGFKKSSMTVSDVVFVLAPRINAAGRIASGNLAVDLMLAENDEEAKEKSGTIEKYNKERRGHDQSIVQEALNMISNDPNMKNSWSTVVYDSSWHKGVIGIVASRLIETYFKPTIILTLSEGLITGSARSIAGFDLHDALEQCDDLLEKHGGHAMAAGLSMKPENLDKFKIRFEEIVRRTLKEEDLIPRVKYDAPMNLAEIGDSGFYSVLKQLAPHGPGNRRPSFLARNMKDTGWSKLIGQDKKHLKLHVKQEKPESPSYPGIAFGQAEFYHQISSGKNFDMIYVLEENEWNGNINLQLNVKDLKLSE